MSKITIKYLCEEFKANIGFCCILIAVVTVPSFIISFVFLVLL